MKNDAEFRKERINKLITELRYEIERGIMEGEIEESMGFQYCIPISREIPNGIVVMRLDVRPVHRDSVMGQDLDQPARLKLVK